MNRTSVWALFIVYVAGLVYFILVKDVLSAYLNPFGIKITGISPGFQRLNIIPGKTLYYYLSGKEDFETGLINIGGNMLLFLPFGFFIPALSRENKILQQTLILAFIVSVFFELLQLSFGLGTFDVDDILLNVAGGCLGFFISFVLSTKTGRFKID